MRQQEFARAIAVETVKKRVAESIDIESMSEKEEEGGRGGGREGGRKGGREGGWEKWRVQRRGGICM